MNQISTNTRRQSSASSSSNETVLDLLTVFRRQFWLFATCASFGIAAATLYWVKAAPWFESSAKMLVTLRDPRLASSTEVSFGEDGINDDILANHMEILRSRRILEQAVERDGIGQLESLLLQLDEGTDAVQYLSEHLKLTKGGDDVARTAKTINIAFDHTDPADAQKILQSIVVEYESFLDDQLERVMSEANQLVREAQSQVEAELKEAENRYVLARKNAPLLYRGEGSSNVFLDKFRRLQDELVSVEIEQSAVGTRLLKVRESLAALNNSDGSDIEKLALIDTESLDRLGVFASLQLGAANSAEFMASQPARLEEARTEYSHILRLMSEASKLEADFGPQHPEVVNLKKQIKLAEDFISERSSDSSVSLVETKLTPEVLLNAYVGFLEHDMAALTDRKRELLTLAKNAEEEAKELIEFELEDKMISDEIDRKQALYEGIVEQLRNLDTASGLSGYVHEVLESPRLGERVWPDLKLCALGGCLLGLLAGFGLALLNDKADDRFRTPAELDATLGIPVVGRVGKIRTGRGQKQGSMIVDAQAPEAEAFRLIRTYLQKDVREGKLRLLSTTSSQSKDGKSTISANIAATFADMGLNVLILDGDMRIPTIQKFFNVRVEGGLSEVLRGKLTLAEALKKTHVPGLQVLTAGGAVKNPAELLDSDKFDELLDEVRGLFDFVVVDSGPILWVSDPAIISQKVDATFLVVRTSRDSKSQALESVRRLRDSEATLRGCIVNTYGSGKEFTKDAGASYYYYYGRRGQKSGSSSGGSGFSSNGSRSSKVEG